MSTKQTIKEFLSLPQEALPGAQIVGPWDEDLSAWNVLRSTCAGEYYGPEIDIILSADRDGYPKKITIQ